MWVADIYCDQEWVQARRGALGQYRFRMVGARSLSTGIQVDFYFYGDDTAVRHLRALLHTDDADLASRIVDMNIRTWVNSLETTVMLETRRPFHIPYVAGSSTLFAVGLRAGDESVAAPLFEFEAAPAAPLNYTGMVHCFGAFPAALASYLAYFRRLIDNSLPIDVRWLNGYQLLEWHFLRGQGRLHLSHSQDWRLFLDRFAAQLAPLARPKQPLHGVMEEARVLAAHAGIDSRSDEERARDPQTILDKTFRAIESMVMTVLNEHPERRGNPVRFEPAEPPKD
jgi:hypothetical protein